jgi:hypothetical protein
MRILALINLAVSYSAYKSYDPVAWVETVRRCLEATSTSEPTLPDSSLMPSTMVVTETMMVRSSTIHHPYQSPRNFSIREGGTGLWLGHVGRSRVANHYVDSRK